MKRFFLIISLMGMFWATSAQERIPVDLQKTQFNLNILDPSVSFELSINDHQSITAAFGLTGLPDEDGTSLNPFIRSSYRNYYLRKRVKKELMPNSGNYIGVIAGYNFDSITDNIESGTTRLSNSFYAGPAWGIQRNYRSGIHLGLSIGGGFAIDDHSDLYFTGVGAFEFGFVIR